MIEILLVAIPLYLAVDCVNAFRLLYKGSKGIFYGDLYKEDIGKCKVTGPVSSWIKKSYTTKSNV